MVDESSGVVEYMVVNICVFDNVVRVLVYTVAEERETKQQGHRQQADYLPLVTLEEHLSRFCVLGVSREGYKGDTVADSRAEKGTFIICLFQPFSFSFSFFYFWV